LKKFVDKKINCGNINKMLINKQKKDPKWQIFD